jgi:cytochrome b6-f complex iron-sulfur subunit
MNVPPVHPCLHRRAVLAGAAGLVGTLAGCSTAPSDVPQVRASTPQEESAPTASAPATSAPAAEPADGTGVVIATVADLAVGGGAVVPTKGGPVLLVRTKGDRVSAYRAACPHAGVIVNAPSGGTVTCPAHHSRFSASDGARISGPAKQGLTPVPSKITGGRVYLL